jgi:hypothetical protein
VDSYESCTPAIGDLRSVTGLGVKGLGFRAWDFDEIAVCFVRSLQGFRDPSDVGGVDEEAATWIRMQGTSQSPKPQTLETRFAK